MYNIPTSEELKRYRKRLGKTQTELAREANVSQSLIARIERGSIDPRVSTLKKIIQALKNQEQGITPSAKDLMRTPIISVSPEDPLKKAFKFMEENNISQMPVLKKGIQMGSISEESIIHEMTSGKDPSSLSNLKVEDIMGRGFPVVTPETDSETISRLVEFNPYVLVVEREKIVGIITKSDMLRLVK